MYHANILVGINSYIDIFIRRAYMNKDVHMYDSSPISDFNSSS
jgi:hypothetical protein